MPLAKLSLWYPMGPTKFPSTNSAGCFKYTTLVHQVAIVNGNHSKHSLSQCYSYSLSTPNQICWRISRATSNGIFALDRIQLNANKHILIKKVKKGDDKYALNLRMSYKVGDSGERVFIATNCWISFEWSSIPSGLLSLAAIVQNTHCWRWILRCKFSQSQQ